MVKVFNTTDPDVDRIAGALGEFARVHPDAECIVYRYNPASIRIRLVDSVFTGLSRGERHDYALRFLDAVPEDVRAQVSILLCLEPDESSLLDLEFRDPSMSGH